MKPFHDCSHEPSFSFSHRLHIMCFVCPIIQSINYENCIMLFAKGWNLLPYHSSWSLSSMKLNTIAKHTHIHTHTFPFAHRVEFVNWNTFTPTWAYQFSNYNYICLLALISMCIKKTALQRWELREKEKCEVKYLFIYIWQCYEYKPNQARQLHSKMAKWKQCKINPCHK